jgi:hypothetical protein
MERRVFSLIVITLNPEAVKGLKKNLNHVAIAAPDDY